ncbi:phage minor structural GP20 family protein [Kurthia sp. 11kri321]|uniref:phage scaffolding protein n=1 Tax=Kurthia sp. 11kri321 TaxID=1750719 RepID=UPI000745CBE2|nr:phage scaffolding protein [Kurthia sp. 11kri321]AMA63251.1 phage minor structural GP20 family protein [Kurthia sp. 11kri321]
MNKDQLVALGLTEEQADKVVEGFGSMVPRTRLNDKIEELKDLQAQLKQRDEQLTELQTKAQGNEELQKQIEALQQQNEQAQTEYQQQLQQKEFDFALTEALRDAKAKNPKAVKALLDTSTVKFVDGKLIGLDEQLTALKTSDDYLFMSDKLKGGTPPQGGTPPAITKEQFASMSYMEKVDLYNKDVELFNKLSE